MTAVATATEPTIGTGSEDPDEVAHWVSRRAANEAAVTGALVVALCGHVMQVVRDPQKFPVCARCEQLRQEGGRW